jgi:hypothetical protein
MLAGPPRVLPILAILLLFILGWSSMRITHTSDYYPRFKFDFLRPKIPSKAGSASRGDPLDFGIPLHFADGAAKPPGSNYSYRIVVPKTAEEDLSWLIKDVTEEHMVVYEVDNPSARYTVPQNKGREAMVYLTYMVRPLCSKSACDGNVLTLRYRSITTTTFPIPPSSYTPTATRGTTISCKGRTRQIC